MPEYQRNYNKWSREQLRKAEATASQFLQDNSAEIANTMRAKARFLETLFQGIANPNTTFNERLEYFARVSEISQMIQADADGFFELASQPTVARIVATVPKKLA